MMCSNSETSMFVAKSCFCTILGLLSIIVLFKLILINLINLILNYRGTSTIKATTISISLQIHLYYFCIPTPMLIFFRADLHQGSPKIENSKVYPFLSELSRILFMWRKKILTYVLIYSALQKLRQYYWVTI